MSKKDQYYETALDEIESGNYIKSIYSKAIRYSNGDDSKIKSNYIKYRFESLLSENQKRPNPFYLGENPGAVIAWAIVTALVIMLVMYFLLG